MNQDILKPKEDNLFSLATEMGLVILAPEVKPEVNTETELKDKANQKTYAQLT